MSENERKLISDFILNNITETDFFEKFPVDIKNTPDYIRKLLITDYKDKNSDDIYFILALAYRFDLVNERYIEILCKLLDADWHYKHEDIARSLQKLKSEKAIEVLYKTVLTKFEYLNHDNSYSLARKCMWALGDINTEESIKKLKLLAESGDEEIKGYAIEQFNREKIKEKYNYNFNNI